MALKIFFVCFVLMAYLTGAALASRTIPDRDLMASLDGSGGGGLAECWNALVEVKSCSNEIILFFLNGQANIGPDCCRGITVITRSCLPVMLTSLGFTIEEGDILRGYCDASPSAPATSLAPAPATAPETP